MSWPPSPSAAIASKGDAQSTESTGIEEGTLVAVIVVAVVVLAIFLAGICFMIMKEKQGKPVFQNLEVADPPGNKASRPEQKDLRPRDSESRDCQEDVQMTDKA